MTSNKEANIKCLNRISQKSFGRTPMSGRGKVHELCQFVDCKVSIKIYISTNISVLEFYGYIRDISMYIFT